MCIYCFYYVWLFIDIHYYSYINNHKVISTSCENMWKHPLRLTRWPREAVKGMAMTAMVWPLMVVTLTSWETKCSAHRRPVGDGVGFVSFHSFFRPLRNVISAIQAIDFYWQMSRTVVLGILWSRQAATSSLDAMADAAREVSYSQPWVCLLLSTPSMINWYDLICTCHYMSISSLSLCQKAFRVRTVSAETHFHKKAFCPGRIEKGMCTLHWSCMKELRFMFAALEISTVKLKATLAAKQQLYSKAWSKVTSGSQAVVFDGFCMFLLLAGGKLRICMQGCTYPFRL